MPEDLFQNIHIRRVVYLRKIKRNLTFLTSFLLALKGKKILKFPMSSAEPFRVLIETTSPRKPAGEQMVAMATLNPWLTFHRIPIGSLRDPDFNGQPHNLHIRG